MKRSDTQALMPQASAHPCHGNAAAREPRDSRAKRQGHVCRRGVSTRGATAHPSHGNVAAREPCDSRAKRQGYVCSVLRQVLARPAAHPCRGNVSAREPHDSSAKRHGYVRSDRSLDCLDANARLCLSQAAQRRQQSGGVTELEKLTEPTTADAQDGVNRCCPTNQSKEKLDASNTTCANTTF